MPQKLIYTILTLGLFFLCPLSSQAADGIADSAESVKPRQVGEVVPKASVRNLDGKDQALGKLLNGKPAVIIFYRGGWCPYCNLQLGKLQKVEKNLKAYGFDIIAISPDKPANLKESVAQHSLSYQLVSDSKVEAAKAFGVAYRVDEELGKELLVNGVNLEEASGENHGALVVPSAFLVDEKGVIRFQYSNVDYKVRVDEDQLLREAKKVTAKKVTAKK